MLVSHTNHFHRMTIVILVRALRIKTDISKTIFNLNPNQLARSHCFPFFARRKQFDVLLETKRVKSLLRFGRLIAKVDYYFQG